MFRLQSIFSAHLAPPTVARIRALLDEAFAGDFSDLDWEHALGGRHVLAWEEERLVAHAALVPRRLFHAGCSLRAGYVEAVGVSPGVRRRGLGRVVMTRLESALPAYDLGALSTTDAGACFYQSLGWTRWEGPTSVLGPAGVVRTPEDDGSIHVRPLGASLDLRGELRCEWRAGDVW